MKSTYHILSYEEAPLKLLDDNPTIKDSFGFKEIAEILYKVVRDTPYRPFTIGVFGEWGSGKTTIMKMIKNQLQAEKIKTVWFNTWKYDEKEGLK